MNTLFRCFASIFLLVIPYTNSAFATTTVGKLYTMSNATSGNELLVYNRLSDGGLAKVSRVPTKGKGTGGGLGNQNAITISGDGVFLFAVNAGSNSISSFKLTTNGLKLVDIKPSGGKAPVSVSEDHGRLFVLNAGDATTPGNINGFYVKHDGSLYEVAYSKRPLSNRKAGTGAAQISFLDSGRQLVVTEKATNLILTYRLHNYFYPSSPLVNTSSGNTPFGFAVGKRNQVFVSNAEGGAADSSSISSYRLLPQGQLKVISSKIGTEETAACWVALSVDGRFAYTTNTASGTISSYRVDFSGAVALLNDDAGITGNGSAPIDMVVGPENRFLYTLNSGNNSISSFSVSLDGELSALKTLTALPSGVNGLAAR
jgi:6-phosphogluconolactonase